MFRDLKKQPNELKEHITEEQTPTIERLVLENLEM